MSTPKLSSAEIELLLQLERRVVAEAAEFFQPELEKLFRLRQSEQHGMEYL